MNEEDLSEAFHDVMVRSSPPPSMDPASALDRARRARKRRTVTWSAAAAVTLVVGLGAGPALVANHTGGPSVGQMVAGGTGTTQPRPASTVMPSSAPTTRKSGDPWPEGQVDRTATAGPRADRAAALMKDLTSSVPSGFSTPNLKYPDGMSMRWPQAQYASNDGEQDYWQYSAMIPVQKDDRVGRLLVQSTTPDGKPATTPCKLALRFGAGSCTVMEAGGKKVGVVTANGRSDFDQWAAYRYGDGTVVYLAQAKKIDDVERSPLKHPVFTGPQLAELVTSAKFKLST
ncbi:MAG TPA: hypothetical protein VGL05_28665 [Kribbella sp.]